MFYCDFDKLLHWQRIHPDELIRIERQKPKGMVVCGPSQSAQSTFPLSWNENKKQINALVRKYLQVPDIDVYEAAFVAEKSLAEKLASKATVFGWGSCAELPILARQMDFSVSYQDFDGLSWEDPDRYPEEIKEMGYDNWIESRNNSSAEWAKRRSIEAEVVEAINLCVNNSSS